MQKQYCCFSEAIRDGAKLRPQSFNSDVGVKSCAMYAGGEAMFGHFDLGECYELVTQVYPYLFERVPCPAAGCAPHPTTLKVLIYHLNDTHHWTREAIADWLFEEEEKLGFVTVIDHLTEALSEINNREVPEFCSALNK